MNPVSATQTAEEAQGPQPYDASKTYAADTINAAKVLWLMAAKYEDRNDVKSAGALWDPANKKWGISPSMYWSSPTAWNKYEPRPVDTNGLIVPSNA